VTTNGKSQVVLLGILVGVASISGPTVLAGQEGSFSFQVRGGASVPVLDFRDQDQGWEGGADSGVSFAMGFNFPIPGPTGGHLGFSQHRFGCDSSTCPEGEKWVSTGFDVAVRLVVGTGRLRPWLQGGLHTQQLEARMWDGPEVAEVTSNVGFGFEAGGGLLVQIGPRMSISPGLRFGSGKVPFSAHPTLRVQYLIADFGLVLGF
jgi:hypothetical protein